MKNKHDIKQDITFILGCGLITLGCALPFCGFVPTNTTIAVGTIAITKGVEVIKVFSKNTNK